MGIVDDLLANPGLYVGKDHVVGRDLVGAARIVVTVLPGRAGVSLDYELLNGLAPGPGTSSSLARRNGRPNAHRRG